MVRYCNIAISLSSPAVDYVSASSGPLEVIESSDEGEDRMRVVGDSKVGPTGVVELLHLTSLRALCEGCEV